MKKQIVAILTVAYSISLSAQTFLDSPEFVYSVERLTTIVCGKYDKSGDSNSLELSGDAQAELIAITKKLGSIGIEGVAKYASNEYVGLLQEDLATETLSVRECNQRVYESLLNDVKSSTIVASTKGAIKSSQDVSFAVGDSMKILDGVPSLQLKNIGTQGPFRIAYIWFDAPNSPRKMFALSPKSRNFQRIEKFVYRNVEYQIEILEILLEDQVVTIRIH